MGTGFQLAAWSMVTSSNSEFCRLVRMAQMYWSISKPSNSAVLLKMDHILNQRTASKHHKQIPASLVVPFIPTTHRKQTPASFVVSFIPTTCHKQTPASLVVSFIPTMHHKQSPASLVVSFIPTLTLPIYPAPSPHPIMFIATSPSATQ